MTSLGGDALEAPCFGGRPTSNTVELISEQKSKRDINNLTSDATSF